MDAKKPEPSADVRDDMLDIGLKCYNPKGDHKERFVRAIRSMDAGMKLSGRELVDMIAWVWKVTKHA